MISKWLDFLSEYLAHRKGLLPLIGITLIIFNYILQWFIYPHWIAQSNLFLHLGLVIAIFGLMLAWAL
ncbi:MAG: hypothetical protein Fur0043_27170 [Anaerolineales bacterium]